MIKIYEYRNIDENKKVNNIEFKKKMKINKNIKNIRYFK
jgi:hypothetical protein